MPRKLVIRGWPRPCRFCFLELAQDNSERLDPRYSIGLQFEDAARPLRGIFAGNAKRRDENALARNQVAAGPLRKITRPRLAGQTFAPTLPRDRRAIPPFPAQSESPSETRRLGRRAPRKI